jgi:hypothetical protein
MSFLRKLWESPWSGAMGAIAFILWEAFWLVGPPIGLTKSDARPYLVFGLSAIFVAGAQAFYALIQINRNLEKQLAAAPRLVEKGTSEIRSNIQADFHYLRVANDPEGSQQRETAKKVAGTVSIFDNLGKLLAPARVHRWAASPQIPGYPATADLQLPIDIDANGIGHPLDVAHKWENEADFYTHNNESVAKHGFKDPNYKFGPGKYTAEIELKGMNTKAVIACQIVNRGPNTKLEITAINDPKFL